MFLYVICESENSSSVKIGISSNPDRRVKQLQTGHESKLCVFHRETVDPAKAKPLETLVHRALSHKKIRGEWFDLSPHDAILEIKHTIIRYGDIEDLDVLVRNRSLI